MLRVFRACIIAILLTVCVQGGEAAPDFLVDGWTLGTSVSASDSRLKSFTCNSSPDFARLTSCNRTQTRNRGYNYTADSILLFGEDRNLLLVAIKVAPVLLTKKEILREIDELSRERGGAPDAADWTSDGQSVIAKWGDLKFEELTPASLEYGALAEGREIHSGVLVDPLGDAQASANKGLPVYRTGGGKGYVYTASFDKKGQGHRQYIAINGAEISQRLLEAAVSSALDKDRRLSGNDYSLWPEVALAFRRFARDTSVETAIAGVDTVFDRYPSKKYRTRVWPMLPSGAIGHLADHMHYALDIYGPKTDFPNIRKSIEDFLAKNPSDRFVEFPYYVIGDLDEALKKSSDDSPIRAVLHYAIGLREMGNVLHDVYGTLKKEKADVDEPDAVVERVSDLIRDTDHVKGRYLVDLLPDYSARVGRIYPHFEAVVADPKTAHADDAAFMLGWLKINEGKLDQALPYLSKAMIVGNGDYKDPGARRAVLRAVSGLPTTEMRSIVDKDANFPKQPILAYVAARSAYREFNYPLAITLANRYLKLMGITPESLPSTTSPERIDAALKKFDAEERDDPNLVELPYLLQASREFIDFINFTTTIQGKQPAEVIQRTRTIVIKYSTIIDDENPKRKNLKKYGLLAFTHRDLRQAIHMADIALSSTPKAPSYNKLREWLYYRKARLSASFAPDSVAATVNSMQAEFPNSTLLDDALAEQLYAEGLRKKDLAAARATFKRLLEVSPNGNAVDNAYSIMAQTLACAGKGEEAKKMDQEIVRRFTLTRHADDARGRLAGDYSVRTCDDDE
ncbi:hypothetical protein AAFG07_05580 [Bradyrhizobium sp. B097]|uniref:hypothetical protein n=1 Tax=Bradyrhizobium sp. B097 TaxID=3140244 RepID=UPI003182D148